MLEVMPLRSADVRWEPFGAGLVLHDAARSEIHVLNAPAALVWDRCDGTTSIAAAADELSNLTGHPRAAIEADVREHLVALRSLGAVGRGPFLDRVHPPDPGPVVEPLASPVFSVLDDGVIVRTNDAAVLEHLVDVFGSLEHAAPPTAELGVHVGPDGAVRVYGRGHDQTLGPGEVLAEVVASLVNRIVATSTGPLALHAGAVRSAGGQVVLLPALSGSGKSTLTAALVQHGWSYLTDEAAGIRARSLEAVGYPKPLSLDATSQRLLDLDTAEDPMVPLRSIRNGALAVVGDGGPVHAIVLPRFDPDATGVLERLAPEDALVELAAHAINLGPTGAAGLQTLVQLAERVPSFRLVHPGLPTSVAAVEQVLTV